MSVVSRLAIRIAVVPWLKYINIYIQLPRPPRPMQAATAGIARSPRTARSRGRAPTTENQHYVELFLAPFTPSAFVVFYHGYNIIIRVIYKLPFYCHFMKKKS